MANTDARKKERSAAQAKANEKVSVSLFKDNGKYKSDVFVGVNGKRYQLIRGVTVEVPRFVADVLTASQRQDLKVSELVAEASAGIKNM